MKKEEILKKIEGLAGDREPLADYLSELEKRVKKLELWSSSRPKI